MRHCAANINGTSASVRGRPMHQIANPQNSPPLRADASPVTSKRLFEFLGEIATRCLAHPDAVTIHGTRSASPRRLRTTNSNSAPRVLHRLSSTRTMLPTPPPTPRNSAPAETICDVDRRYWLSETEAEALLGQLTELACDGRPRYMVEGADLIRRNSGDLDVAVPVPPLPVGGSISEIAESLDVGRGGRDTSR